jgi:hypothetical protein
MATRSKAASRKTSRNKTLRKASTTHKSASARTRAVRKTRAKTRAGRKGPAGRRTPKRWSQRVTRESDALDLEHGVFKQTSAKKIAASLKHSAEASRRRKAGAYRSALSMLTFYINRAGKNLPKSQRTRLERVKHELKREFDRE